MTEVGLVENFLVSGVNANRRMLPPWLVPALLVLIAVGSITFVALLLGNDPSRAWRIYHVNFVFWSGAAISGAVVASIFQVTSARWQAPIHGLAEATAAFLPVSFFLFLGSWFGRREIFSWADPQHTAASPWLTIPFLYGREAIGLLLLFGMGMLFAYRSVRGANRFSPSTLAVVVLFLYVIVYTMFAWDFVMSLDPTWSSTLFGGYFFVGNLYLGWALLTVAAAYVHWWNGSSLEANATIFRNLGSLLLTFSLLWAYLLWSQYLVIWYGNLPREIRYVLLRTASPPWSTMAVAVVAMNFLIPFVILLSRAAKSSPKVLMLIAGVIIAGIWMERFLLVVPALSPHLESPFAWPELAVTAGFLASFVLIYLKSLSRISRVMLSDRDGPP